VRTLLIGLCSFLGGFLLAAMCLPILVGDQMARPASAAVVAIDAIEESDPADAPEPQSPEDRAIEIAQTVAYDTLIEMKANMRDPGSSDFRNLYIVNVGTIENPMPVVCGEVNARNAYGGYTGFVQFYAAGSFVKTAQMEGFTSLHAENCLQRPQMTTITF